MKKRLLRRIKPFNDEPIISLILRLADANYVDSEDILAYLIQDKKKAFNKRTKGRGIYLLLQHQMLAEVLSRELSVDAQELQIASKKILEFIEKVNSVNNPEDRKFIKIISDDRGDNLQENISEIGIDRNVLKRYLHSSSFYCAECIKEEKYVRINWLIRSSRVCLKHKTLLINFCPYCGKKITYQEVFWMMCGRCGNSLASVKSLEISNFDVGYSYQQILENWFFHSPTDAAKNLRLPEFRGEILFFLFNNYFLKVASLYKYSFKLQPVYFPLGKNSEYNSLLIDYQLHVMAFSALANWPYGMYSFFNKIIEIDLESRSTIWKKLSKIKLHEAKDEFYIQLHKYLKKYYTAVPNDYYYGRFTNSKEIDDWRESLRYDIMNTPSNISFAEASEILLVGMDMIKYLISIGLLRYGRNSSDLDYSSVIQIITNVFNKTEYSLDKFFKLYSLQESLGENYDLFMKMLLVGGLPCFGHYFSFMGLPSLRLLMFPMELIQSFRILIELEKFLDERKVDNLLIKVQPHEHESFNGYMKRLGGKNYYFMATWWTNKIRSGRGVDLDYVFDIKILKPLSHLLGLDIKELSLLTIHRYAKYVIGEKVWNETGRNIYLAAGSQRYCPLCYEEGVVDLLYWRIRPVTVCFKHQILLFERCESCKKTLIGAGICRRCRNKVPQKLNEEVGIDKSALELTELIYARLGVCDFPEKIDKANPLYQLSGKSLFSALTKLSTLLMRYDPEPNLYIGQDESYLNKDKIFIHRRLRELKILSYHTVICTVFRMFMKWPNNFHEYLTRILDCENQSRMTGKFPYKQKTFAYELKEIIQAEPDLDFVWIEFCEFINKIDNNEMSGISFWRKYSKKSILPKKIAQPESVRNISLEMKASTTADTNFSYEQCLKYLGVSRMALRMLIDARLIKTESRTKKNSRIKWRFSRNHLDMVVSYLFGNLKNYDPCWETPEEWVSINQASVLARHAGIGWLDIVNLIFTSKVQAKRNLKLTGFSSVFVNKKSLDFWISTLKHERYVSIYVAMKQLKCGVNMLVKYAQLGLLVPLIGYPGNLVISWRYDYYSIKRFPKLYVDLKTAAELIQVPERVLVSYVKRGFIDAVAGPSNGVYKYIFDRQNILNWRFDRLVSKELKEILAISQRTMEVLVAAGTLIPMKNMPRHPYWFDRQSVEKLMEERKLKKAK